MKARYPITPQSGKRTMPIEWLWIELDERGRKYWINEQSYKPQQAAEKIMNMPAKSVIFFPNLREQVGKLIPYLMQHGELSGAGDQLRSLHFIQGEHVIFLSDASLYFPNPSAQLISELGLALYDELHVRLAPTPGNTAMRIMRRFVGISSIWQPGDLINDIARGSLTGGALHWNVGQYSQAYKYDIRSAYAWAMSDAIYPIQTRLEFGPPTGKNAGFILVAEINYESENKFSPLIIYGNDDEAYHPTRSEKTLVAINQIDLASLGQNGLLHINKIVASVSWQAGPPILADTIAKLEDLQNKYKTLTPAIKTIRNAIYGKFAESDNMSTLTLKMYSKDLIGKDIVDVIESDNYLFALVREHKYKPAPQHNPLFAGLITARVRSRLYDAIDNDTVYADTDGFISTKPRELDFGERWGQWRNEGSGEAVVLGPRIYGMANKTKIAGQHKEVSMRELMKALDNEVRVAETITPNPMLLEKIRTTYRTLHSLKYPHVETRLDNLYITRSPTIKIKSKIPDSL